MLGKPLLVSSLTLLYVSSIEWKGKGHLAMRNGRGSRCGMPIIHQYDKWYTIPQALKAVRFQVTLGIPFSSKASF